MMPTEPTGAPDFTAQAKKLLDILEGYTPPWDDEREAADADRAAADVCAVERFRAAAFAEGRAQEREACAEAVLVRSVGGIAVTDDCGIWPQTMVNGYNRGIADAAAAIRARGLAAPPHREGD